MKKRLILGIGIIFALILLFPVRGQIKDGGSVEYRAILYSITDVHRIKPLEEQGDEMEFYEGVIVKIFGVEIFNNVK